ncbi:MAG TPA: adenylate/guanylate cyclase domain-containing protein [Usitatibacter sp.]|nr:adenylate/guanylate cyclase domain-containing protein [Usitatibacter sp.]
MKLPLLEKPSLQDRIVIFFVVLLAAVQLASFVFIRYTVEQTAQNSLRDEMRVAARVFKRLLDQNSQQLVEATSVLTYDFGFREAIATRDRDTILSALRNHSARIKASGMAVIGMDGLIVADTLAVDNAGKAYPHPELVARAALAGRTSSVRVLNGKPYQVVVVPVLAPLPIAWVSMSFVMDDNTARDLQRLSSAEVTFVRLVEGKTELLATTLPPTRRDLLLEEASHIVSMGRDGMKVQLGHDEYEVLATPLEEGSGTRLFAILQRSVAEGIAPYLALQAVLLLLAAISVAVTLAGGIRIARRITLPVSQLAEAARDVARGHYDLRVRHTGDDEIGELSRAFDSMVRGLIERDSMRDALGKVASSEVVQQLLQGQIELGGEERDVTVMFTDIRNYTALCETLTPQQSLSLLNQFLTAISEVVEKHGGVVDKYLGDGVMALFGAPVMRPDDAQRALDCALDIRRRVAALGPSLATRGLPHPEIGIGVNTSSVVAGNIGSPTRLNYTVLGDGVNLASRLEGLTKRYLVPIVVGSLTRDNCTGIVWRELDKVRVRGKQVPERIYEPLGREGEVTQAELARLVRWHEALSDFRERRWNRARTVFESLSGEASYARLATLYLGYIRDLIARPPGPDWDASFTLYDK